MDRRALGLYLKFDVEFQSTTIDIDFEPRAHRYDTDLEFVPVTETADPVGAIGKLDRRLLDHERSDEVEMMIADRPGFVYRRRGRDIGYGFGCNGDYAGPILTDDPSDLAPALSHLENTAAQAGHRSVSLEFSLDCRPALDWTFRRGHRFYGFHGALLGSSGFIPRDRYIFFSPGLIF